MTVPDGPWPRRRRRDFVLLGLVLVYAAGLFMYALGAGSLWDVDEPRYAQASREILATGDAITMHLDGQPWYGPPPLWLWLEAATGRVIGFSEFTMRIWAALFGVAGVAVTCVLGWEWFGPRTGILSGLILATTLEYLLMSHLAVLDLAEVTFLLLALHACYRGYRDRRAGEYLRASVYAALATLTRGPVTVALLIAVGLSFLLYRRALRRVREIPWVWGSLVYLAIASPWYVVETARGGAAFLRAAFTGPWMHSAGPRVDSIWYDVAVLVLGAVPWAAFFPGALVYHYNRRWQDGSLLCLLWCGIVFVGALAIGGRLPDDIFPIFPVAAIAIGRLWEEFLFEGARLGRMLMVSFFLQMGVVVLLAVAVATFATVRYPHEFAAVRAALLAPLVILVVGPTVTALLFSARRYMRAFLALPATMAVFVGVLYTVTAPAVEQQKPIKPLAARLVPLLSRGDEVIGYRIGMPASLIYYTNHPVIWVNDPQTLRQRLCASGRIFLVTARGEAADREPSIGLRLPDVISQGDLVVREKSPSAGCMGAA